MDASAFDIAVGASPIGSIPVLNALDIVLPLFTLIISLCVICPIEPVPISPCALTLEKDNTTAAVSIILVFFEIFIHILPYFINIFI